MKNLLFSIILSLSLVFSAFSQGLKTLPEDPEAFIQAIPELFQPAGQKMDENIVVLVDSLTHCWNAQYFSDEEKFGIIKMSRRLLDRRMKADPHFVNFFTCILNFSVMGQETGSIISWIESLEKYEENGSLRQLQGLIQKYTDFFQVKELYSSNSFSWTFSDSNYRFEYAEKPRFLFGPTDLLCATKRDTSIISGTQGIYYPEDNLWTGFKGKVTWRRFDMDADSLFVILNNYNIELKYSSYKADSVVFFNRYYFDNQLFGAFEEKVFTSKPNINTKFPQFSSYLKNLELKEIYKGIDYEGGFTLHGLKLIGSGDANNNATVRIRIDEDKYFLITSHEFFISKSEMLSDPASVSIIFNGDSIFHPGLRMKYNDSDRLISLIRNDDGISQSPFFNTFHKVDMYCSAIYWNLEEKEINFDRIMGLQKVSVADFVSNNFYSEFSFDRLQGIDDRNPLYVLRRYSIDYGTRVVKPGLLAAYMDKPIEQVKAMLIRLSTHGFLYYDIEDNEAIIQQRLFDFIESKGGQIDYDVIRIHSETQFEPNATLSLETLDLLIRGVEDVFISDSQNVFIYPRGNEIILKKNRDFVFTGKVRAGLFEFFANECSFEYDSFRLNLPTVDSLSFRVEALEEDEAGNKPLKKVNTVIEDLSGILFIDEPNNKSGLNDFPEYPMFKSEQESFVYYDRDSAYNRSDFMFHVEPFQFESLDRFSTEGLEFDGYLASNGIFPDIENPLKVQPDYSLGFIKETPPEGYPVYNGKGTFYTKIDLSNLGLRAQGTLEYNGSVTESEAFNFYPDSMIATNTYNFGLASRSGEVSYPRVRADSIFIKWLPHQDTMLLAMLEEPFHMFDDKATFAGGLIFTDHDLTGTGAFKFESSEMFSYNFNFGDHTVDADTTDFRLFTANTDSLALTAQNYRTHLDFDARLIEFRTNNIGSMVDLPYNKLLCSMESIDWYMDRHELVLSNDISDKVSNMEDLSFREMMEVDLSGSDIICTKDEMDSLTFFSGFARYDMLNYTLFAEDVYYLDVADASIFPAGGNLTVKRGGLIDTLVNANIIANRDQKYHHIKNAAVRIFAKSYYEARGTYSYIDVENFIQDIELSEIRVDTLGNTVGKGYVKEDQGFTLNPFFKFTGSVNLYAYESFLNFDGGFKIIHDCYTDDNMRWAYFNSFVDPDRVILPVSKDLKDIDGQDINVALFVSNIYDKVYPVLFSTKKVLNDTAMVSAHGVITYDTVKQSFLISPEEQLYKVGGIDKMVFDTRKCEVTAKGPINLGVELDYVKLQGTGSVDYLAVPDSTLLNISLAVDFFFSQEAMDMMKDSIIGSDLPGLDLNSQDFYDMLGGMMSKERLEEYKSDLALFGMVRRLPEELVHTFFFADLDMYWNSETHSFISKGPIGINNIGTHQVNRYVNGNIELIKKRSGDELNIYLELNERTWYFFNYRTFIMQSISSNMDFNNLITEIKPEKRILRDNDFEESYEYVIATRRKRIDFLRRMDDFNK